MPRALSTDLGATRERAAILGRGTKILIFDLYGTIVDMQAGLTEAATPYLKPNLNSEIGHKRNAFRKTL